MNPLFLTLAQETATAAATPEAASPWFFLQIVALGLVFYFLIIRPPQKRAKEQAALIDSVKTGDKVVMSGGIHGIVSNVKETTVIVKVADNVKIEFSKAAIASTVKPTSEQA